jgi:hypothetical protein
MSGEDSLFDGLSRRSPRLDREAPAGQIILSANKNELLAYFVPPVLERSGVILSELELKEVERVDQNDDSYPDTKVVYENADDQALDLFKNGYKQMALLIGYEPPKGFSQDKGDSL